MSIRNRTPWALAAWASLVLPVMAVAAWPRAWWPYAVLTLWTLGIAVGVVLVAKRWHRRQSDRIVTQAQLSSIRTLSHHRHDWMNELQILYGYLRLNKPDKAIAVVDRIRERMEQDSRVSQIGEPELATFLLSFRAMCDTVRLEVDVQNGFHLDGKADRSDRLAKAIIGLVGIIRYRASSPANGVDNVLKLGFSRDGGEVSVSLVYEGELAASDSVVPEMERCVEGIGTIRFDESPAGSAGQARTMVVRFPLPA
ncbi:Spo0B domain-containing protein [Cohnella suwonensis]|uniref:Spo0B domain-containing protein n=1 Tax=Cohnella suwonensis TaxID=696072 RepID=A0ABW0LW37_9BACL